MAVGNIPLERFKLISAAGTATLVGVLLDSDQAYLGDFSVTVPDNAIQDLKSLLVSSSQWVDGAAGSIAFSSIPIHTLSCKEQVPSVTNFKARVEAVPAYESFSMGAVAK
jgi:hypothetical protein